MPKEDKRRASQGNVQKAGQKKGMAGRPPISRAVWQLWWSPQKEYTGTGKTFKAWSESSKKQRTKKIYIELEAKICQVYLQKK